MYKVHHGIHPQIITNLFTKKTYTNMPITRQKQHYIIPRFKSKSFERSIAIQGPKYYNDYMNKINVNCSIHTHAHIHIHIHAHYIILDGFTMKLFDVTSMVFAVMFFFLFCIISLILPTPL